MAKVASTPIDVILGEAVHGSRTQRFRDMVAIASVIHNRSQQLGKPAPKVVGVRSEFNAYGKALPAGVERYRSLAQQAWDHVQANGPVHDATFYATPSATKNLPKGLSLVTKTSGHQYFKDPQGRSIRTADGFVRPKSMEALAPGGLLGKSGSGGVSDLHPAYRERAQAFLDEAKRRGLDLEIASSRRSPEEQEKLFAQGRTTPGSVVTNARAGQSHHNFGTAFDVVPRDLKNTKNWSPEDPRWGQIGGLAREMGFSWGGDFKSKKDMPHIQAPGVSPSALRKSPLDVNGYPQLSPSAALSVRGNFVPTPTERPGAPLQPVERGPSLVASAPRATGTRGPIKAVAPAPSQRSFPTLGGARTVLSPTPGDRLAPAPASRLGPASAPRLQPNPEPEAIQASRYSLGNPAPQMSLAEQYASYGAGRAPQTFNPLNNRPNLPNADGSYSTELSITVTNPRLNGGRPTNIPSIWDGKRYDPEDEDTIVDQALKSGQKFPAFGSIDEAVAAAKARSNSLAAGVPGGVPAAPPPAPINPMQAAVDAAPYRAPEPDIPRGSQAAYDFYNGMNDQAFASTGEALNRDARGNTYITNKYGVTTGTDQRGNSFRASSIPGPLDAENPGEVGIRKPDWEAVGARAKPMLGGAIGGGLGGLLGPVGGLLGSVLGKELAKPGGGKIGDFVRGTKTVNTSLVQGFGNSTRFAKPQGGLAFPDAPGGGAKSAPKYSDNDYERMSKVSPKAAKDIKAGRGGLF